MAPKRPNSRAAAPTAIPKSTEGIKKRQYKRVRIFEHGMLDVERKTGKYLKIARQNQRQSPLLKLPAEIRNTIFRYVLGGYTYDVKCDTSHRLSNPSPTLVTKTKHNLALLSVCRQLYGETALLPFSLNVFSAAKTSCLQRWIESRHIAQISSITKIRLRCSALFTISTGRRLYLSHIAYHYWNLSSLKHVDVILEGYLTRLSNDKMRAYKDAYENARLNFITNMEKLNPGVRITMTELIG